MLRRLRTGLIGLGLCCVFAAATVGMAIVSTVALSSLTEQRAPWAGMLAVVAWSALYPVVQLAWQYSGRRPCATVRRVARAIAASQLLLVLFADVDETCLAMSHHMMLAGNST